MKRDRLARAIKLIESLKDDEDAIFLTRIIREMQEDKLKLTHLIKECAEVLRLYGNPKNWRPLDVGHGKEKITVIYFAGETLEDTEGALGGRRARDVMKKIDHWASTQIQ